MTKEKHVKGITKRGDKWQVRKTYKGHKIYEIFLTYQHAEKYLQGEMDKIDQGQYVEEYMTLEEVYLFMDKERRLKGFKKEQSSKVTDNTFYSHIAPVLGLNMRIDLITRDNIREFQSKILESGLSVKSKGNVIALVKQIFKTAMKQGWLKVDHTEILEKPRDTENKEPKIFTKEKQDILFAEAERKFKSNPNLLTFLALGVYGGLRRGEIFGLQWQDIDFENHDIHVVRQWNATVGKYTDPKTEGSKTSIPMCPELQAVLERLYSRVKGIEGFKETHCVITRRKGGYTGEPLSPNGAYYLMYRLTKNCGLPEQTSSHVLRKTCNTYMVSNYGLEAGRVMMRHTAKRDITWSIYTNKDIVKETVKKRMWEKKGA